LIKKLLKRQKILKSHSERFLFFKRMNFDQNFFLFYCCKNVTVPFHCDCALVVQKMFGKNSVRERKKNHFFFQVLLHSYLGQKSPSFFFLISSRRSTLLLLGRFSLY